jgi:membrane-associated phospholipid phosphatase
VACVRVSTLGRPRPAAGAVTGPWWPELALLAGFVALTAALAAGAFLNLDVAVARWCDAHRPAILHGPAYLGNHLAQGTWLAVIALVIAVLLGRRRHTVRLVLPVLAAELLSGIVVEALKLAFHRSAPGNSTGAPHPERLFSQPDGGLSYPSGHLVVAFVWYGILALLLTGVVPVFWLRVLRYAPPVILFVTTIYLSFHWLTDSVAGILLGLLLYRLLLRVPWQTLPLGRRVTRAGWAGPGWPDAA